MHQVSGTLSAGQAIADDGAVRLTVTDATAAMAAAFGLLAGRGVHVLAASIGRPSLDDVFFSLTAREAA